MKSHNYKIIAGIQGYGASEATKFMSSLMELFNDALELPVRGMFSGDGPDCCCPMVNKHLHPALIYCLSLTGLVSTLLICGVFIAVLPEVNSTIS